MTAAPRVTRTRRQPGTAAPAPGTGRRGGLPWEPHGSFTSKAQEARRAGDGPGLSVATDLCADGGGAEQQPAKSNLAPKLES